MRPRRGGRARPAPARPRCRRVRWTISDASASRRLASRPSRGRSEAAPISRSGAPVARATPARPAPAPPSRASRRRTGRPPARRAGAAAATSIATSHGACSRTTASPCGVRIHDQQVGRAPGSRAGRRRGPAWATRTRRSGRRCRPPAARSRRAASAAVAAPSSLAATTQATISSRGGSARGERPDQIEQRFERAGARWRRRSDRPLGASRGRRRRARLERRDPGCSIAARAA